MKKIYRKTGLIIGLAAVILLTSCREKIDPIVEELNFDRAFTPTGLTYLISNVTTVTLTWNTAKNIDHYVLEIYEGNDPDFPAESRIHSAEIASTTEPLASYVYVLPAGDTQFSARVRAISSLTSVDDSKWNAIDFMSAPENLFTGYISEMTGLNTCIVRWKPGTIATALLFVDGATETSYTLAAGEITAGVKTLTDVPNGDYEVRLMNSTFVRGRVPLLLEGDMLLDAGGDIAAAIASAPAGGVILLKNGESFSFTGPVSLTKSVKIRGVFATNLPKMYTVLNAATYHMFNIDPALTAADSLVFENIDMTGFPDDNSSNTKLRGMFDQDALACTIGTLKFEGCILRNFDRHLVRLRGTVAQAINSIEINNCILYNYAFGSNYGVINSSSANGTIRKISITNSTISYIRGAIVSNTNGPAFEGITISNCTFNQLAMDASTGRYVIDLNGTTGSAPVTISNCLFGSSSSIANGIRLSAVVGTTMTLTITGSFYTSDYNDGTTYPIKQLMTAYSGLSTALWVDPAVTYDFHFLDGGFTGKTNTGDPRWRP